MNLRWTVLTFGATLLLGISALSPIPVADENEWEQFAETLNNPDYRLPTTTRPSRYSVIITPHFEVPPDSYHKPFTFDGLTMIEISATRENVREIVMHCDDLTISTLLVSQNENFLTLKNDTFACDQQYSFLKIELEEPLIQGLVYTVSVAYTGNLQTNMRGFYRSWYRDSSGIRWMATTQFQPGHARQAFPCYDEPGFKAYFDIMVIRDPDFSPTISNMPIRSSEPLEETDKIADIFHTTPLMSTYLIAFIVSHYDTVAISNNKERVFEIYARNTAFRFGNYSLEVGEKLLNQMEVFTDIPYYEMADYINMKQAAIPDFSAGAMENWGLLTYREALILYDPENTNHFYKQRVANIISHEVTHMWFGNLVTCAWWDNLWLNEGFARYYQYFLTHMVEPEFGYDTRFVVEQVHQAMTADSVDTAHALINPDVGNPASVSAMFSSISYAKGASILRMTQFFVGNDTFTKGLRKYLKARSFEVAEPHHLFENLQEAVNEDRSIEGYVGITIDSYFSSWSEKAGHPVLTVRINQRTGEMVIVQDRWERDTGYSKIQSLWQIPITWTRAGAPNFDNLKPPRVITRKTSSIKRGTLGLEWVIFNKQATGFYKVNYDDTNWALLTEALRNEERTVIHELNRAQIVDDLFNFARAGVMRYNRAFNILSFLEWEDQYAPWLAAISGYNFALGRLATDNETSQRLKDEIIKLSAAVTNRLGYAEKEDEPFMDGLLRMYVMTFLCDIDHSECTAAAKENFAKWKTGGFIPPNMRPWVYCSGLRQGTPEDFNLFWDRYLYEDLASEVVVMINAAGCTSDQASLEKFMDAIVSGRDVIRPQDWSAAWSSAASGNPENPLRMFNWLTRNVNQVIEGVGTAATPISNIASRLRNDAELNTFSVWLEANRELLGSAYNTGVNGIATTRNNLAWTSRRVSEFRAYLDTGYVKDVIPNVV